MAEMQERANSESIGFPRNHPTHEAAEPASLDWDRVGHLVLLSRALDELEESELAPSGEVPYQFSAKGHELAQVLLALNLIHPHDAAGVYYRSRPFMLAAGLRLEQALAAGMGKVNSPSEGRDVGVVFSLAPRPGPTVLPASGGVGAQYTPIAGWAQAIRYRAEILGEVEWEGALAVAMGGDGSVATNGFWSALTMATTLKLPMLFFIEDNGYGLSVPGELQTPEGNIAENLASFRNLLTLSGSGFDPSRTSELILEAIQYVRSGTGPCLLHLRVPRLMGHTFIDNQAYRPEEELAAEQRRDPVIALQEVLGETVVHSIRESAQSELEQAVEAARALPDPEPDTATDSLFYEGKAQKVGGLTPELGPRTEPVPRDPSTSGPRVNLIDAVRTVMENELQSNPRALVFGEDVGAKGGVHSATRGLQSKFGEERVFDTSLSEEGIIGRAVGMALAGLLPIPEIQFRKYADPAAELTLVTWGAMVHLSLEAAERFEGRVEVLDLRTISPWDEQGVLESVRRTGRCLVVQEDTWTAGFASEILATVASETFMDLDAPVRRLTTPNVPIPYNAGLMHAVLPSIERIEAAIEELLTF